MKLFIYITLLITFCSGLASASLCGLLTDINGNNRIGIEEAVYALQVVAEIRTAKEDITLKEAVCALKTVTGIKVYSHLTAKNYEGTWEGNGKFINNKWTGTIKLNLSRSDESLSGTLTLEGLEPSEISCTLTDGILSFKLPVFDPDSPECSKWDVPVTLTLDDNLKTMNFIASGTFCGENGGKHDILSATLSKIE